MTEREQETVARLTKLYDEGKLDGASAHNAVENIRSKYGYSGGADGSGYVATTGDADPAQAIYDRLVASERQSRGGSGGALEQLARMTYSDWKRGGEYEALQEMYRRNANQMQQDVIGQLSARTGGLASSYAAAAASQQYADVMSQLEAVARQMYEGDRGAAMDIYQLQQQAEDKAYDRAMVERQYKDSRALQQKQEAETSRADARDRVNAYLAAGGSAASLDPSLLRASGYSDAEIAAFEKYYAQQLTAKKSTVKVEEKPKDTRSVYQKMYDAGVTTEDEIYEYLLSAGYDAEEISTLTGHYDSWLSRNAGLLSDDGISQSETVDNSVTKNNLTTMDYNESEGIITWNGRKYRTPEAFKAALNRAYIDKQISEEDVAKLIDFANRYYNLYLD